MPDNNEAVQKRDETGVQETRARPMMAPPVDIYENADEFRILADLPGVDERALSVRMDGDELTIEAPRGARASGAALVRELPAAGFRRVFRIPEVIDAEKIDARLRSGVLEVVLPKVAAAKPRQIQVRTR
ncbi:MAG: Hsp20/alpha crystallin family protein [Myxococcales bacterium]|nr:Hsp20/alpha crystallin family protein [Myxococcales bacterium]MCB9756016.1 Hsp20/alpha crystallin family protein [Myxococcales bacterium]